MMDFLKTNNKTIYVGFLLILAICLLLGYVPGCEGVSLWVTPPVALFLDWHLPCCVDKLILNSIKRFLRSCCNIRSWDWGSV